MTTMDVATLRQNDVSAVLFKLLDPSMIIRGIQTLEKKQSLRDAKFEVLISNGFFGPSVEEAATAAGKTVPANVKSLAVPAPVGELLVALLNKASCEPVKKSSEHDAVVKYAVTLSRSGNVAESVSLLKSYIEYLPSVASVASLGPFKLQALWGLAAGLISLNSTLEAAKTLTQLDQALEATEEEARKVRQAGKLFVNADEDAVFVLGMQRVWLAAWAAELLLTQLLAVEVNEELEVRKHPNGEAVKLVNEILFAERTLGAIARFRPELIRYVVASALLSPKRARGSYPNDAKAVLAVAQSSPLRQSDAVVSLFVAINGDVDIAKTSSLIPAAVAAIQGDFLLHSIATRFTAALRTRVVELVCRIHSGVSVSSLTSLLGLKSCEEDQVAALVKSVRCNVGVAAGNTVEARIEEGIVTAAPKVNKVDAGASKIQQRLAELKFKAQNLLATTTAAALQQE